VVSLLDAPNGFIAIIDVFSGLGKEGQRPVNGTSAGSECEVLRSGNVNNRRLCGFDFDQDVQKMLTTSW
jgi:hypothetical protein